MTCYERAFNLPARLEKTAQREYKEGKGNFSQCISAISERQRTKNKEQFVSSKVRISSRKV